jgi:hypothetical protein
MKDDFCSKTPREEFGEVTGHGHQGNTPRHIGLASGKNAA